MIIIQKIGKLFILLLIVAGLSSCGDDTETAPFEVIGEVIIAKRMINEETNFARIYYAYGNQPMASATVTLPEGGTIQLSAYDGTKRTYLEEPSIEDFSTELPEIGQFDFAVVNEDIEHTVTETLEFNDLPFAIIDSVGYSNQMVHVEWQSADDADSYHVRMVDDNYEPVFVGQLLNNTVSVYEITLSSSGWAGTPEQGKTYGIEVLAYKYEDGLTTGNDYLFNVNDLSISSKEVIWGE